MKVFEDAVRRRAQMQKEALDRKLAAEKAEQDRIAKLAADQLKKLTDDAENYQKAEAIRAFVDRVGQEASGQVDLDVIARWRLWALAQADALDPIKTARIWKTVEAS